MREIRSQGWAAATTGFALCVASAGVDFVRCDAGDHTLDFAELDGLRTSAAWSAPS